MKIKFYTIDCPKCDILEEKLQAKNLEYEKITDTETMIADGVDIDGFFPFLKVDNGPIMGYGEAIKFINSL